MKHILICLAIIPFLSISQTWNSIGNPNGIAGASEVDLQITPGGKLYAAYIDLSNASKVSVVRWDDGINQWKLIGSAGIGNANVFDLQLIVLDEIYPVFAAKTFYQSSNQALEIYKFDGTSWTIQSSGMGNYNQVEHNTNYALSGSSQNKWFLTFKDPALLTPTSGRVITINMANQALYGTASSYALLSSFNGKLDASVDESNAAVIHGQIGVTSTIHLDASNSSGIYSQNHTFETNLLSDNISKMQIERNENFAAYGFIWASESSGYPLKFNTLINNSLNSEILLSSGTSISDFEFDMYTNDAYVFYKTAASCFYTKISNITSPLVSTISSGSALAPATATSLETEVYNDIYVIAYVDQGKFFVKEYNLPAQIEDYSQFALCESSDLNNPTYNSIYCSDPNFSHQGLSMTCISQNIAVIPNTVLTVNGAGSLQFSANIGSTAHVSSPTIVDLQVELFDNGVFCGTRLIPVTIYPKPEIAFTNPIDASCKNADPVNLNSWALPAGGTWSGTGILNNILYPGYSSGSAVTMHYTKTNQYGCTGSDTLLFTLNYPPTLDVTTNSSDCNQSSGTAWVTISDGLSPYSTYWSNGSTQLTANNLSAGQHIVSVTDANGCLSTATSMIGTNGLSQTGTIVGVSCNGSSDGAISITPASGIFPLVYSWSNGATSKDISGLKSGPYELTITDAAGCVSAATYFVPEPQKMMLNQMTVIQPACSQANGQAVASFTGGTAPLTYTWTDLQGTILTSNNASLSNIGAGSYYCTVTDANNCTFTSSALISNNFGPNVVISSTTPSSCSNDGAIQVIAISESPQSYLWTNGATTPGISNLSPGYYSVSITDASGCMTVLGATVGSKLPPKPAICMVTVEESSKRNQVIWEKPLINGIDRFNIYRETSQAGLYQLIGSVSYLAESVFIDSVASPEVSSRRYKIASVNNCGVESEWSSSHKTIHLTVNRGLQNNMNLTWDKYEGFNYSNFILKRYTNGTGWETLATMPNNLFTYTDQPSSTKGLQYVVTADAPISCSGINTTRSNSDNRFSTGETNSLNEWIDQSTRIYPNPADTYLNIDNNSSQLIEARILDQTGRVISSLTLILGQTKIDCGKLAPGVYNIELQSPGAKTLKRFVIER